MHHVPYMRNRKGQRMRNDGPVAIKQDGICLAFRRNKTRPRPGERAEIAITEYISPLKTTYL